MKITYQTNPCRRCGGSGRMPYAVQAGICFRCEGSGTELTAAGKRAKARVEAYGAEHMTVAASTLQPGDRVILRGGEGTVTVQDRVTTLGQGPAKGWTGVEGTDTYVETWQLGKTVITTTRGLGLQLAAHSPVRLAWTPAHVQAAAETVRHLSGAIVTD